MKVLHLREAGSDAAPVALHPQVTVVRGLADERRTWLIDVLSRLAEGSADAEGEVDAHGIRFPLDPASLELLGLDRRVPAVVRAADLPGHDPRSADAAVAQDRAAARRRQLTDEITSHRAALGASMAERSAATAALDEIERGEGAARDAMAAVDAARTRQEAEVASATAERVVAEQALGAAVVARDMGVEARASALQHLESARARHRDAMAAASVAAAAVEEASSVVDQDPTEELAASRDELARAEQAAAELDPEHDASPLNRRLAGLEARRVELDRLQEALGPNDASPVAVALDRLEQSSTDAPPVVAALALADTWRDLHQQIHALDAGVSPAELAAEERVAMAKRAVVEAESDFNQPVLTPEQIAKVEAAHNAVLEAQDRTEGRFGGGRSRKRLDEIRIEERRVLERLGFSTYADYMMSSSSRGVGPANRAILETARSQLAHANEDLAALPGAADRARRRTELFQRRDAVAPRVADLLGHEPTGPEAEDELRHLRESGSPDHGAIMGLADALGDAGIAVGPPPYDRADLELLARSYLAEQRGSDTRRSEVEAALGALDVAIATMRDARQAGAIELPELPELPELARPVVSDEATEADARAVTRRESRWSDVEAARAAVGAGESAVSRHRGASDRLAELHDALARTAAAEASAASAVAAAEADLTLAEGPAIEASAQAAAEAETTLARARAREHEAQTRLAESAAESGITALVTEATQRLRDAELAVTEAAAAEQATAAELAVADADYAAAKAERQAAEEALEAIDRSELLEQVDWELLSRLASVRSAGLAGSVPLVLDDPFAALEDDEVARVLDRVTQLAGAVQVILVSDRSAVADWASALGPERAAIIAA
ncbi:MAG: hypothetical protein JWM89_1690 [Acidimicrobiales bacterium]|nr:hypothetical protein [Acidimicrobiales bacterium]